MMQYKGYIGKVEYDDEAEIFHGDVVNIRDVVTFQGKTVQELKKAFRDSVDVYLDFCAKRGEEPDKPCSGHFVTRIPPDLHRRINTAATVAGKSVNSWVAEKLEHAVSEAGLPLARSGGKARTSGHARVAKKRAVKSRGRSGRG
jgi:predicted HicB family RNase H-like nuclease